MKNHNNKFGVLSHVLPPASSGQAVMLYRILEGISKENYCLISRENYNTTGYVKDASRKLPAKYYSVKTKSHTGKSFSYKIGKLIEYSKIFGDILYRTKQIKNILKKENAKILIVCSGDFTDMVSGYLAAKFLRIKLVPYMFDWFSYQWTGIFRTISKNIEPSIIKKSSAVIVPNEFLQKEIMKRYNKKSIIIRNPCLLPDLTELDKKPRIFNSEYINIVYTGAVYRAHYDAFRNLIEALKLIKNYKIKLHIYTAQPEEQLEKEKIISDSIVTHPHVKHSEINNIQRQADILFLPLAFQSPISEVINTSAPGKFGEYLAVGRPILAHVPKESFVKWYLSKNKCGVVVDKLDAKILAKEIIALIKNKSLQNKLSINSRYSAVKDFDVENVRKKFISFMEKLGDK